MNNELIETYRDYKIVWGFNRNRHPEWYWLPTIVHPEDSSRTMASKTLKGCRSIIDSIHEGVVSFR